MTDPNCVSFRHRSSTGLLSDERGLSTVEYVVILVLIAVAAIGTWKQFGGTIMARVEQSANCIRDMEGNCGPGSGQPTPASNNDAPGDVVTPSAPPKPNVSNPTNVVTPTQQPAAKQAKGKVVD